jgi:hypothetical protein
MIKNNKRLIIGALFGVFLSIITCFTQKYDVMAACFWAAPAYINSLIFLKADYTNVVIFIYYISIFSLIGYLSSLKLKKSIFFLLCLSILIIHFVLLKLEFKSIFAALSQIKL